MHINYFIMFCKHMCRYCVDHYFKLVCYHQENIQACLKISNNHTLWSDLSTNAEVHPARLWSNIKLMKYQHVINLLISKKLSISVQFEYLDWNT